MNSGQSRRLSAACLPKHEVLLNLLALADLLLEFNDCAFTGNRVGSAPAAETEAHYQDRAKYANSST
jgi:hypothetical protein